jgi:hypothetical protein
MQFKIQYREERNSTVQALLRAKTIHSTDLKFNLEDASSMFLKTSAHTVSQPRTPQSEHEA